VLLRRLAYIFLRNLREIHFTKREGQHNLIEHPRLKGKRDKMQLKDWLVVENTEPERMSLGLNVMFAIVTLIA
jgi:hypothetical protein